MVTITREWLESGMKGGVGIKSKQCRLLGIPYPPKSGWKNLVIGKTLTDEEAQTFLTLRNKRLRNKKFIEQAGWKEKVRKDTTKKETVRKPKKAEKKRKVKVAPKPTEEGLPKDGTIVLTQKLIDKGLYKGQWTKAQCMLLGIPLNRNRQYKKLLIGKEISVKMYEDFLSLQKGMGNKVYRLKMRRLYTTLLNQSYAYNIPFSELPKLVKAEGKFRLFAAQIPYYEFLNSAYWRSIASHLKDTAGKCELCGMTARLVVHHKTYRHHGDELNHLDDLIVLCRECHEKEHKLHPELNFANRIKEWGIEDKKAGG